MPRRDAVSPGSAGHAADPTVRLVAKPFLPADLTAAVAGLLGRG